MQFCEEAAMHGAIHWLHAVCFPLCFADPIGYPNIIKLENYGVHRGEEYMYIYIYVN